MRLMDQLMGPSEYDTTWGSHAYGDFFPQDMPESSPTGRTATQAMEEQRLRARSNLMTVISTPTQHRSIVEGMDFSAIEERVVAQMLSAQATRSFARLADAGQSAALSMAEMERALRQNVGHPPTKLTKAELEPHPDTGKQVKPARIQRSLLGSEVTDVRLKSGRIERKAALQTTVEIKFKRRNQPKTG